MLLFSIITIGSKRWSVCASKMSRYEEIGIGLVSAKVHIVSSVDPLIARRVLSFQQAREAIRQDVRRVRKYYHIQILSSLHSEACTT